MRKNIVKGACILLGLCLSISAAWAQESTENKKTQETQTVSSEKAGMSNNANDKKDTFKPSDYTLDAKKEYIYEFMGLKFKLSDKARECISNKRIAMLDDQSPLGEKLKYAMLTFNKMTEEQKNALVDRMGDGYEKWQEGLQRAGTIGMFDKNMSEEEISKITKCDTHKKIGESTDGKYNYYLSSNSGIKDGFLEEFNKTQIEIIEKKAVPENGFVLSEKTDLENTEAFNKEASKDLSNLATKDINGKEFSSKDFAKYDLTMVNVFATWCTACVKEIPDLVELQKEMKDKGVNIVGVVTDTVDNNGENIDAIEKAKLIQEKTKASYQFLMPDRTNFNDRLSGIQAMPETFFVDKNGKIVGNTYSGAKDIKEWKEIIEKELMNIKNK